jgi:predicted TPR repeat methyltransferase
MAGWAQARRPIGLAVFTLEHAVADGVDYRLERHGRYCHARGYVERLLACAGLQSKIIPADLRTEAGAPVPGLVIRAAKSGSVQARPITAAL